MTDGKDENDERKDPLTGRHDPQDHRPEGYAPLTPEQEKARARRNMAIALGLVAFIVLIFVITVINLQQGVAERPL